MSRIPIPSTIEAAPEASRPLLAQVKQQLGVAPNLFRLVANSPAALEGYVGLMGALGKGTLPAATRQRIALAVADRYLQGGVTPHHRRRPLLQENTALRALGRLVGEGANEGTRRRRMNGARKVLVMGLPGAGKTTLARLLVSRLNAVHFNADEVRANINKDLGFTLHDRIEQARRMGWLCDRVVEAGIHAVADFICPTAETRDAFGDAFVVWVDRTERSHFPDTDALFQPPERWDIRVEPDGSPAYWAERACDKILPTFDPKAPTALFVGRYQPFHDGHKKLIEEGLRRVGQVCIAVRDTHGTDDKNPLPFEAVKSRIEAALWQYRGRVSILQVPNVTSVFYGRDVGYTVERLVLDEETERISATEIRGDLSRHARAP